MKALIQLIKIEILGSVREFSSVLFGILLPAGIMLLLGILYGDKVAFDGAGFSLIQQAFPAVVTIGICASGLMGIPITISAYREKKILKRFQVTPISPLFILLAEFVNQLITAIGSAIVVWMIAAWVFGYEMLGSVWHFILAVVFVIFPIYALGMCIASLAKSARSANVWASAFYFPMLFLSGATIPYEIMPAALQSVAKVMPLTQGIILLKGVSLGEPITQFGAILMLLLATALIATLVSVKVFRYEY